MQPTTISVPDNALLHQAATGAQPGALVWQVDNVDDYRPFAAMFAAGAHDLNKEICYFHFVDNDLIDVRQEGLRLIPIQPQTGFEPFLDRILQAIQEQGAASTYLFDCVSPLAADWFSDQMVGNFFVIVCRALQASNCAACFAILRNQHSQYAIEPITRNAQVLLDVCPYQGRLYVQPLKVEYANFRCRHTLHVWEENHLTPVLDSHTASAVLTSGRRDNLGLARHHLGVWSRTFVEAEALLRAAPGDEESARRMQALRDKILRMAVTRDAQALRLVQRYFSLEELVFIGTRMLGTGLIGNKAADMLLARAVLLQENPELHELLETHDSFYVPSDVFYTFLVQNDCWELRRQLLHALDRRDVAAEGRRRILNGVFPPHIIKRFSDMLDYFGETPLVVRSSSLLEDSLGNAFAGRYESVFCANQGDRAARLDALASAIKTVYASAMGKEALDYRAAHGLLERDEQMAILVQRVSGAFHGSYYFSHLAGVGFSFNPYVWHESIDPRAGVLRLVFGLGTRAVDCNYDDYTRLVALNAPLLRSDHYETDLPMPTQQWADVLDLELGKISSVAFRDLAQLIDENALGCIASEDPEVLRAARKYNLKQPFALRLSFDKLLSATTFPATMSAMLRTLENAYGVPVDMEFSVNLGHDGSYRIHLLQCRPMQIKGVDHAELPALDAAPDSIVLQTSGPVIGRSRFIPVDYLLYIVPKCYSALSEREQYAVARLIGEFNRRISGPDAKQNMVLIGPGRWGSTTPALGLPVAFTEINRTAAICEILEIRDDLITEVSLGTHFFNDLVELDILYMALKSGAKNGSLDKHYIEDMPNRITAIMPEAARYEAVIRLIASQHLPGQRLYLRADTQKQHVCLYRV